MFYDARQEALDDYNARQDDMRERYAATLEDAIRFDAAEAAEEAAAPQAPRRGTVQDYRARYAAARKAWKAATGGSNEAFRAAVVASFGEAFDGEDPYLASDWAEGAEAVARPFS